MKGALASAGSSYGTDTDIHAVIGSVARSSAGWRACILLAAGDKSGGSEQRFYRTLIGKADARLDSHLERLKRGESARGRPRRKK